MKLFCILAVVVGSIAFADAYAHTPKPEIIEKLPLSKGQQPLKLEIGRSETLHPGGIIVKDN